MSQKIKDLKQEYGTLTVNNRAILDKASAEKRVLTADETTTYENADKRLDAVRKEIEREEKVIDAENYVKTQREEKEERKGGSDAGAVASTSPRAKKEYKQAFINFMLQNGAKAGEFANILSTGDDPKGGYLLPEEYETEIIKLLYALDPMRALATVKSSRTTVNIPIQSAGVTFAVIPEGGTYPSADPTLGRVVMRAVKMGGFIKASDELVDESDVASFINSTGSQALANLQSELWFTGDDATEPQGIFTATSAGGIAVQGITGGVSASAAITGDNLIDTQHKLKTVYRNRAAWLMHDDMVKLVRKLKDSTGQYLWQPGLQVGTPDRLIGRPIYTSEYAPAPAVSTKSIIYGDLKSYQIRDRLNTQIKYFDQLFGATGEVGWRFTYRGDGRLVDGNGIVTFTHGAAA